jgi:predicted nucleotide-binding protein
MLERYPQNPKEQYDFLVDQAERYAKKRRIAERTLRSWQNRAADWLKRNVTNSGLASDLVVIPPSNIRRGLGVLLRARNVVPELSKSSRSLPRRDSHTKTVFIVHGHDESLKNAVKQFLSQLGLRPVILHELPNRGRTIIEKFIDHSDVAFAVVLLTPDDKGGSSTGPRQKLRYRARQNVILELGYFLGRLGRANVAAIYDKNVEMPSDYEGVLFLPFDERGRWRRQLVKELKAAKLPIDVNQLRS